MPLVLLASKLTGRPVKWTSTRTESFLGDAQARDNVTEAVAERLGVPMDQAEGVKHQMAMAGTPGIPDTDHPAARATGRWTFGPWTRRRRQAIPIHDGRPHGAVPAVLTVVNCPQWSANCAD